MLFNFLVYNKFKYRKWSKLDMQKRWDTFQKLEVIQARRMGREPAQVVFKEMDERERGCYVSAKNTIFLNKMFIEQDELRFMGMFTIFHEGRHAYQHKVALEKNPGIFSRGKKWRSNFEGYIGGAEDEYTFYSMQPVERDANKYALQRLKHFQSKFIDDRYYVATLKFEEKCFEDDKFRAKEELGMFYKHKVAKRTKEESEQNFGR